jgi:hypothetical protein
MVGVKPGLGVVSASTQGGSPVELLHCHHAIASATHRQPQVLVAIRLPAALASKVELRMHMLWLLVSTGQHSLVSCALRHTACCCMRGCKTPRPVS